MSKHMHDFQISLDLAGRDAKRTKTVKASFNDFVF